MEIPPLLIQFGGSLVAIFALYGLARWLGLGGKPMLKTDEDVRLAADEVESGYLPVKFSISRNGDAVLARDESGRIMVIKRHGHRLAGRILTNAASVREEVDAIIVKSGESQFGSVRLSVSDSAAWADAINRL